MIEKELEIYGKKYRLRAEDEQTLIKVARHLDSKLRSLFGDQPQPLDTSKLFSLALNLAEELYHLQEENEKEKKEVEKELEKISAQISELETLLKI